MKKVIVNVNDVTSADSTSSDALRKYFIPKFLFTEYEWNQVP